MEVEEAVEFHSAALPAKPQTRHPGTGDTGVWEELSKDREGERAGFVSINAVVKKCTRTSSPGLH